MKIGPKKVFDSLYNEAEAVFTQARKLLIVCEFPFGHLFAHVHKQAFKLDHEVLDRRFGEA